MALAAPARRLRSITRHVAAAAPTANDANERPPASPTRRVSATEFVIGPDYRASPETKPGPEVPRGVVTPLTMRSEGSRIYPGIAKDLAGRERIPRDLAPTPAAPYLNCPPGVELSLPETVPYERAVAVYVPHDHDASVALPFIVVNDGMGYVETMVPALDSLIAEGRIPKVCCIFLNSGGDDAQGSQRGLEYDTVDGVFAEFLDTEVVPMVEASVGIKLTTDPEGRAMLGGSSGGSCAFSCAWFRPDLFRRVLTYSGTFVNQQAPYNPESPTGCWEYHSESRLIQNAPRKPLKVCLFNPTLDNGCHLADDSYHNWTTANYRMSDALREAGYDYQHTVCEGGGHVDGRVVVQTMAGGLEWLWAGYEP